MIRREVAVVQGWCPVEDLIRCGFGQSPVVMVNEAHSGLTRFDQTVTVAFPSQGGEPQPWVPELLAGLGETLAAYGGAAGILRDQAPRPLDSRTGVDALVVSTDNALT